MSRQLKALTGSLREVGVHLRVSPTIARLRLCLSRVGLKLHWAAVPCSLHRNINPMVGLAYFWRAALFGEGFWSAVHFLVQFKIVDSKAGKGANALTNCLRQD